MKKLPLILSCVAIAGVIALAIVALSGSSQKTAKDSTEGAEPTAQKGAIVYFNLDRVLNEYDMANDLRSVVETKIQSINEEVNRRGTKLENDLKAFQDKIDKGLLTRSVAEVQGQKLQEQQNQFQTYAAQKQQEMNEEQAVMMNNIADAIKSFIESYNEEHEYAMILTTQGDILPAPVVCGEAGLDITDDVIAGLNAEYVKTKSEK